MHPQAQLRRLLKSTTIADIHKGLQQLDEGTAAALCEGIAAGPDGSLQLNRLFSSGDAARAYRTYAALHLLDRAGAALADVRGAVTSIALRFNRPEPAPLDLSPLDAFPALAGVTLINAEGAQVLPSLPHVQALDLRDSCGLDLVAAASRPLHTLTLARLPLDEGLLDAITNQPALRTLSLLGCPGLADLTPLAPLPGLTSLTIKDCPDFSATDGISALTALQELSIAGGSAKELPATGLTALETVYAPALKITGDLNAPGLRSIHCLQLEQENSLTKSLQLETVSIDSWYGSDLRPFAKMDALTTFTLAEAKSLLDLGALSAKPVLERVTIGAAEGLEVLAPLAQAPGLRHLRLTTCQNLITAEGLRGCPALETLELIDCGRLEEIDALETTLTLKRIDLTGCINLQNVQGLRDLPALTDVTLPSTRGGWTRVYHGEELETLKGVLQERYRVRTAMQSNDPTVVRVRELLIHGDLFHQRRALEVMRSFGTDFAKEVLVDCTINAQGDVIVPFGEPSESVLIALAELGQVESDLTRLRLDGDLFGQLEVLKHFPKLERLELRDMKQLTSLSGVENCQRLQTLLIHNTPRLVDIAALRRVRSLQRLEIAGQAQARGLRLAPPIRTSALRELSTLEYLRELDITGCGAIELNVVGRMKRLRALRASAIIPPEGIGRIAHLTELEEIEIRQCKALEDLHAIGRMPNLKRLMLGDCRDLKELRPFYDARQLESLQLGGEKIQDASALGVLENLTFLALQNGHALESIDFLSGLHRLEVLYIGGAQNTDLRALSGLNALTDLTIQMLPKLRTLDGLEGCPALTTLRVERGCDALTYTEAILSTPHLESLRLNRTDALQVAPERPNDVNLNAYRGRLQAFLRHKQRVTRDAMAAALAAQDAAAADAELADLKSFADPRLVVALLAGISVEDGRPKGGLVDGSPLSHAVLVNALQVGITLHDPRSHELAAQLTAPLALPDDTTVTPATLLPA